jgi:threonine-phosphate decarboxylase
MLNGHGDDTIENNIINYSSNVWYGADLAGLTAHLIGKMGCIRHYPEVSPKNLIQKIAEHHNLPELSILVTNGATEAIYLIAQAFSGSQTTIIYPTFAEYADACYLYNHQVNYIHENDLTNSSFTKNGLIFICNPNNPTGKALPSSFIESMLTCYPEKLFVIDEAYSEFSQVNTSVVHLLNKHSNLVILKSVTKSCCIPGLRLGYILSNQQFIEKLISQKMPWSVNSMAIEAGIYIYDHFNDFTLPLAQWLDETKWLIDQINKNPSFLCYTSDTTYFLCTTQKGNASALKTFLLEKYPILIRDASNFKGLTLNHFRLCTQSREDNLILIEALWAWTALF